MGEMSAPLMPRAIFRQIIRKILSINTELLTSIDHYDFIHTSFTAVFISVNHGREVACNVPTRFSL